MVRTRDMEKKNERYWLLTRLSCDLGLLEMKAWGSLNLLSPSLPTAQWAESNAFLTFSACPDIQLSPHTEPHCLPPHGPTLIFTWNPSTLEGRQEEQEFKTSIGYTRNSYFKKKEKKRRRRKWLYIPETHAFSYPSEAKFFLKNYV